MTLEELQQALGRSRYEACSGRAWEAALETGYGEGKGLDSDISHEIGSLLFREVDMPDMRRVELLFAVYRDMPCYGLLMYVKMDWPSLPDSAKALFWEHARDVLESESDALARPLQYSLWCDFFEDPRTMEEAWKELACETIADRALRRVLAVSGPVRYELKRLLYDRLLPEETWHEEIFRSLLHSEHDVFGEIDRADASRLLRRLRLPEETEHLERLKLRLTGGSL